MKNPEKLRALLLPVFYAWIAELGVPAEGEIYIERRSFVVGVYAPDDSWKVEDSMFISTFKSDDWRAKLADMKRRVYYTTQEGRP